MKNEHNGFFVYWFGAIGIWAVAFLTIAFVTGAFHA
jgi:hypothetical protein